jgi:hypothetical protein
MLSTPKGSNINKDKKRSNYHTNAHTRLNIIHTLKKPKSFIVVILIMLGKKLLINMRAKRFLQHNKLIYKFQQIQMNMHKNMM